MQHQASHRAAIAAAATPGGAAPASGGALDPRACSRTYQRRLLPRIAVCLALGLMFPGRQLAAEPSFVGPPAAPGRLRGGSGRGLVPQAAEPEGGAESEAALRAKVEELERRLGAQTAGGQAPSPPQPAAAESVNPSINAAWEAVLEELKPALLEVNDARLATMASDQFVIKPGEERKEAIYKRKYQVLGATINQQEMYMKSFKKVVRLAKNSEKTAKLIDMMKKGVDDLDRKKVRLEVAKLQKNSREATIFFRDVAPEVMEDPVADTISGLLATFGLLAVSFLLCLCLFPPIPPGEG